MGVGDCCPTGQSLRERDSFVNKSEELWALDLSNWNWKVVRRFVSA